MNALIKVMLVDDHPVVRQGLKSFLDAQQDMTVVAEASDGAEATRMAAAWGPDVILLDLKMPGVDGRAAIGELAGGDAAVIVLTSVTETAEVPAAMRSGAKGFLYKDVDPDSLAKAIRTVHEGQVLLAAEAAAAMVNAEEEAAVPQLTQRERQVLRLVAAGRSNREIARELAMAEKTVKTHVSSVLRKLEVADRTQAALYAVRHDMA